MDIQLAKGVSIFTIGLFAGSAFNISYTAMKIVKKYLTKDSRISLFIWRDTYQTAAPIQASLAMVASISSGLAFYLTKNKLYLCTGLIMFSMFPFTKLVMHPQCNGPLLELAKEREDGELEYKKREGSSYDPHVEALILKWGNLHLIRTVGSCAALALIISKLKFK
eukprot:gene9265-11357_t